VTELGPFTFWELLILTVVTTTLIGGAAVWLVHDRLRGKVSEGHNDVVVPIYATAGVIYAVLLAFIVIAVWEQYTAAKENVVDEASALTTMYREATAMPPTESSALRELVRGYTEAVAGPEWKAQQHGATSPVARQDLEQMYRNLGQQPPGIASSAINTQFLDELGVVASDRTKRTLESDEQLPWVLWLGLIMGGIVVVVMTAFLYMENARPHAALSSVLAAMIGVMLFITLVLDHPFRGKIGIDPGPFEHATSVYASLDQGH
jgi:hypothetical protein